MTREVAPDAPVASMPAMSTLPPTVKAIHEFGWMMSFAPVATTPFRYRALWMPGLCQCCKQWRPSQSGEPRAWRTAPTANVAYAGVGVKPPIDAETVALTAIGFDAVPRGRPVAGSSTTTAGGGGAGGVVGYCGSANAGTTKRAAEATLKVIFSFKWRPQKMAWVLKCSAGKCNQVGSCERAGKSNRRLRVGRGPD